MTDREWDRRRAVPGRFSGIMTAMAKRSVTLQVDEALLEAAQAEGRRTGRSEAEVIELALRQRFEEPLGTVAEQVWARNASEELSEEEVLALARAELVEMRRERGGPDKAAS